MNKIVSSIKLRGMSVKWKKKLNKKCGGSDRYIGL